MVENPEYAYVLTDSADRIVIAVEKNANVFFGAGVPQQVVDYINEKIAELSLDEYEDIVAFLNGLEEGDKTLQTLLNEKVDKEEGKSLIDSEYASTKSTIDNPEFLEVTTDSEGKLLAGRTPDGAAFENVGFSTPKVSIDGYIIENIEDQEERTEIKTDSEGKILSYRDIKGNKTEKCSQIFEDNTTFNKCINGVTKDSQINGEQDGQISALRDKVNLYEQMFESLSNVPISETHDAQNFSVDGTKQKLLLTLHKRSNNGYDTDYSAFLPNARNDFSDVRVTSNGKTLPFMFLFRGNIDIISDSRIAKPMDSLILFDGTNYITVHNGSVCSTVDFVNFTSFTAFTNLSVSPKVCYLTANRTLFVGIGYELYRSEYPYITKSKVIDVTSVQGVLRGEDFAEFNGYLFYGHYQVEKIIWIERSADDGVTWETIYREDGKYQHIHHLFVDTHENALYAGLDGVGYYVAGILKTTDGTNFINLRNTNKNIPLSTDYGVIYADAEKRFLGGETSIVGGHSIIKTTDDSNFVPVLSVGKGCYWIRKYGNILFGCLLSSSNHRDAQIIVSYDEGSTWQTAYITPNMLRTEGASDGWRMAIIGNNEMIAEGQYCTSLRIKTGTDEHYAQILVEVPEGVSTVTVESGYMSSYNKVIHNVINTDALIGIYRIGNILSIKNNEEETILPISTDKMLLLDTFGSYMTNFNREDGKVGFNIPDMPIKITKSLPLTFHIGFYLMNVGEIGNTGGNIILISDGTNSISKNGNNLYFNGAIDNNMLIVGIKDSWDRIDMNILSDKIDLYINGKIQSSHTGTLVFSNNLKLCYGFNQYIANFEITNVLSEDTIREYYFSDINGKI